MKNTLNEWLTKDEASMPIDIELKQRLRARLERKARRPWRLLMPIFVPMAMLGVFALAISFSPLGPSQDASFLKRVEAAYEEAAAHMQADGLYRHTITVMNGRSTTEAWTNLDGTMWYTEMSTDGDAPERHMLKDNVHYTDAAFVDSLHEPTSSYYSGPGPQYIMNMPDNVGVIAHLGDPADATVQCIEFTLKDDDVIAIDELRNELYELSSSPQALFDLDRLHKLTDILANNPYIEDLGEQTSDELGYVHVYRLMSSFPGFDEQITDVTEYFFDALTYMLVATKSSDALGRGEVMWRTTVDEVVQASDLPGAFANPEAHGLKAFVPDAVQLENLPEYEVTEGCYRYADGQTWPEKLSAEETAEVYQRINALREGRWDEENMRVMD